MKPFIVSPTVLRTDTIPPQLFMNRPYADAIERAGGIMCGIARPKGDDLLDTIIERADGLLLMGGHDIDPRFYDQENRDCGSVDPERDELEFALLTRALAKGIPVLGICRGFQVMNVACGGTLYQDVAKELPGALTHDCHYAEGVLLSRAHLAHDIRLAPDSRLAHIIGAETLAVNSLHHQGIRTLAPGFRAAGHAPDGLIEAIEHETHPFAIGIEWHPEELSDASQKIFAAFIAACRTTKNNQSILPATALRTPTLETAV